MIHYSDLQNSKPQFPVKIQKVGVKGVSYPIIVKRDGKEIPLFSRIDIYVDLPINRKGADISRNLESINEVINNGKEVSGVEYLSSDIAKKVLEKFPYSERSEVHTRSDYFVEKESVSGRKSMVKHEILGDSYMDRSGNSKVMVGVVVTGISACPCAMETTRSMLSEEFPGNDDLFRKIPSITHNQRNKVTFKIETLDGSQIEANDLIEIVESSLSGPLLPLLKRSDEGSVVYHAHKNPKFVEDIVREVSSKALSAYPKLPDKTTIEVVSESEESIHAHNAYAEIKTTFGDLRKSLDKET